MLGWMIENTVIASVLAGVLLLSARWLERRPAVGNFGWLLVIVLLILPPMPKLWSLGVRDVVTAPVGWAQAGLDALAGTHEESSIADSVWETRAAESGDASLGLGGDGYRAAAEPALSYQRYADAVPDDVVQKAVREALLNMQGVESANAAARQLGKSAERTDNALAAHQAAETAPSTHAAEHVATLAEQVDSAAMVAKAEADEPAMFAEPDHAVLPPMDWPGETSIVARVPMELGPDGLLLPRRPDAAAWQPLPEESLSAADVPAADVPDADESAARLAASGDSEDVASAASGPAFPWLTWGNVLRAGGGVALLIWIGGAAWTMRKNALRVRSMRSLEKVAATDEALTAKVREIAERLGVRPPRVVISEKVDGPMVWSLGRPVLVWPASESVTGRGAEGMIAHELAHVRRGDHWSAWLELAALTLFWWHPLVWFAHRNAREYAELACDAWVSWALPSDRRAYAEALVSAATRQAGFYEKPGGAALAFGVVQHSREDFTRRLTMVMTGHGSRRLPPAAIAAGLGLVMMLAPGMASEIINKAGTDDGIRLNDIDRDMRPIVQRALLTAEAERLIEADMVAEGLEKYAEAIELGAEGLYEEIAMVHYYAENWRDGAEAFLLAYEEYEDEDMLYNAACCAALAGKNSLALDYLERAIMAGYSDSDHMSDDSDLEAVQGMSRFADLAAMAAAIEEIQEIADEAEEEEEWDVALTAYTKLVDLVPDDLQHVHNAGYTAIMGNSFEVGREWLDRQLNSGYLTETAMYNYACLEAKAGNESDAMEWLGRAVEAGFSQHQLMAEDSDLDSIRDRDGFAELMAGVQRPHRLLREMELASEFSDWDTVTEKAEDLIDVVGEDDWRGQQARRMLAQTHATQGDYDKAIELTIESAEAGHNSHGALRDIARYYAMAGDPAEGAVYLAALIEIWGHDGHSDNDDVMNVLRDQPAVIAAVKRVREREELEMFEAVSWEQVAEMGRAAIENDSRTNGWSGHMMLGWAMLRTGEYDKSAESFKALYESGTRTLGAYNTACAYSLAGDSDAAFAWLDKAIEAGFADPYQYADDPDLEPLHSDSRWDVLLDRISDGEYGRTDATDAEDGDHDHDDAHDHDDDHDHDDHEDHDHDDDFDSDWDAAEGDGDWNDEI